MKLENKKELAARTLGVGKNRIIFNIHRLNEIKEAITKNDIKDLYKNQAISIKEIKGRRKVTKRKTRRKAGSIRKKIKAKKQNYVILTRKFRNYLFFLKNKNQISKEVFLKLRKEIRASKFKDLNQLKERISEMKEWKH